MENLVHIEHDMGTYKLSHGHITDINECEVCKILGISVK